MENKTFKVTVLGDAGVGKTTYINRLITGDFNYKYVPTIDPKCNEFIVNTTKGELKFIIRDIPILLNSKESNLGYMWSLDSDAFILMCDNSSESSIVNIYQYCHMIEKMGLSNKPIIVCENKFDISNNISTKVLRKGRLLQHLMRQRYIYHRISVKSNNNIEEPILQIAILLLSDQNLEFHPSKSDKVSTRLTDIQIISHDDRKVGKHRRRLGNKKPCFTTNDKLVLTKVKEEAPHNVLMKIPDDLYNRLLDILGNESIKLKTDFQNCKY
jgi:GTP-binding nuclear protein Ran